MNGPTLESYWVEPGVLLAGTYPGAPDDEEASGKIDALLAAGVGAFVDLTEDGELLPYAHLLPDGVSHDRLPIVDLSCATPERMRATLDLIDARLARKRLVYVHCRGGCGRTGTVAGCWLVRHGLDPRAALDRVEHAARAIRPNRCPETEEQRAMVLAWAGWGQR